MAYRLLNDRGGISVVSVTICELEPSNNKGITSMDFGVVLLIANSLLAAFIYLVLNWLWQD